MFQDGLIPDEDTRGDRGYQERGSRGLRRPEKDTEAAREAQELLDEVEKEIEDGGERVTELHIVPGESGRGNR